MTNLNTKKQKQYTDLKTYTEDELMVSSQESDPGSLGKAIDVGRFFTQDLNQAKEEQNLQLDVKTDDQAKRKRRKRRREKDSVQS